MFKNSLFLELIIFIHFLTAQVVMANSVAPEEKLYKDCQIYLQKSCKNIPDSIQLKIHACEITQLTNNCEERKKNDKDQWRYQNCNPYSICQMIVDKDLSSNACFVGMLELPRQIGQLSVDGYNNAKNYIQTFDEKKATKLKKAAHKLIEKETYTGLSQTVKSQIQSLKQKRIDIEAAWLTIRDYFDNEVSDFQCLNSNEKTRLKCAVLADVLSGVALERALVKSGSLALKKGGKSIETVKDGLDARKKNTTLVHIAKSSDKKRYLVERYGTKNLTTEAENIEWKKFVESPSKNKKTVTIENINLKELNDVVFKDEQYVTSITNLYKDMQLENLKLLEKEIQKKNPKFKFNYFSDFKTVRVAYDDLDGIDITKMLNQNLNKTNQDFANFTLKEKLVREADKPASWFKASSHTSDDWTNLVSRYSRENPNDFFVDGANDPKFKTWANERFIQAKELHEKVLTEYKNTNIVTDSPNGKIINRDLFEIMRKNKDHSVAKSEIERNFGLQKLSDNQYNELRDYFNRADNFAPGLRNTKREFATLADSHHGGISIDMIGLGADHIQATSSLALSSSKNIDELIMTSRRNEQILTDDINRRKSAIEEKFKEATGDKNAIVTCSGDGCKAYLPNRTLSKAEADRFVDNVTLDGEAGRLRFSSVSPMNDATMYDYVAKQGEDIEKIVRKKMLSEIDSRRLKGINISVDINTVNAKTGTAAIRASKSSSMTLSASDNIKIQKALQDALKELNLNYLPN